MKVILVTGGAGFIGSNFVNFFLNRNKNFIIVNMDKLTYAGNLSNIRELEGSPRHYFVKGDICNSEFVNFIMKLYRPDYIINFAAESHVDRSINHPAVFGQTNVVGTLTLLEAAKFYWSKNKFKGNNFIQISTDEVYGSIDNDIDFFMEESNLEPNSPYSATKASADLMVRAFSKTYGFPAIITRCCNNYGPYQNTEKFVPRCITNALRDKSLKIYGDGSNVREWIHVTDHCLGIIKAMFYGTQGEVYNIGSGDEISNIDLARTILRLTGKPEELYEFVEDRPGHDKRYALNSYKIRSNLNWSSRIKLEDGLISTIEWYQNNRDWWE